MSFSKEWRVVISAFRTARFCCCNVSQVYLKLVILYTRIFAHYLVENGELDIAFQHGHVMLILKTQYVSAVE